jgi:hypothetical protein
MDDREIRVECVKAAAASASNRPNASHEAVLNTAKFFYQWVQESTAPVKRGPGRPRKNPDTLAA